MDISDLVSALVGFLAGFSFKVVIDRSKTDKSRSTVDQSGSVVGKNQVGRDYHSGPGE